MDWERRGGRWSGVMSCVCRGMMMVIPKGIEQARERDTPLCESKWRIWAPWVVVNSILRSFGEEDGDEQDRRHIVRTHTNVCT